MPLLDFTGTFGLRVAGCDVSEVRIAGMGGRWERRVNLATNPSFEATSGTVVVRTNLVVNPVGPIQSGVSGAALQRKWSGSGGTTAGSWVTGAKDGPTPGIKSYDHSQWTSVGTNALDIGASISAPGTSGYPVTPGKTEAARIWLRYSIEGTPITYRSRVRYYDAAGVLCASEHGASQVADYAPNKWVEFARAFTPPAGAVFAAVDAEVGFNVSDLRVGDTRDATGAMLEASPVIQPYFDGNTRPVLALASDVEHVDGRVVSGPLTGCVIEGGVVVDPDFTPAWTGPVGASTSVLRGVGVTGVGAIDGGSNLALVSSTRWAASGGRSVRVIPRSTSSSTAIYVGTQITTVPNANILQPGRMYRIHATCHLDAPQSGQLNGAARRILLQYNTQPGWTNSQGRSSPQAPNQAGDHVISWYVTIPDDVAWAHLRLYNGASAGNGDVWWDDLTIEDITDATPTHDEPFHGDTPDTPDALYRWDGPPHASPSAAYYAWQPV